MKLGACAESDIEELAEAIRIEVVSYDPSTLIVDYLRIDDEYPFLDSPFSVVSNRNFDYDIDIRFSARGLVASVKNLKIEQEVASFITSYLIDERISDYISSIRVFDDYFCFEMHDFVWMDKSEFEQYLAYCTEFLAKYLYRFGTNNHRNRKLKIPKLVMSRGDISLFFRNHGVTDISKGITDSLRSVLATKH